MQSTRECAVLECNRIARCKGWCQKHYARWKRNGYTHKKPLRTALERFESRILKDECWHWQGAQVVTGYGHFHSGVNGKTWLAHRFAYTALVGEIPVGFHIDHLCRNRMCVNPDHLEAVTPQENQRRAVEVRRNDICPQGHPRTPENTRVFRDGRQRDCLVCYRFSNKRPRLSRAEGRS